MKKRRIYLFLAALITLMLCAPLLLNTSCLSNGDWAADSEDTEASKGLVKAVLVGIRIDTAKMVPAILLKEADGQRYLPIWIGSPEAYSIALEMAGTEAPRPLTHDLIIGLLEDLGAVIDYIVVSDLRDDIFYANIYLRDRDNNIITIDSRPSDAIALAVRVDCNIFVKEDILDEYGMETTSPDEQYMEI